MSRNIKIKVIKELHFQKPDGEVEYLEVPESIDQTLLGRMVLSEYAVFTVSMGRELAESEVATLKSANRVVGYIIPGQAILSPDNPKNSDRLYGTYSLIPAIYACIEARRGEYTLVNPNKINSPSIFNSDTNYAVIWLKALGVSVEEFKNLYFVSLTKNGIYYAQEGKSPCITTRTLQSYNVDIKISKNPNWPNYIRTIISELSPFATDPFLRFFYLYQVIETLMTLDYESRFRQIRDKFDLQKDLSITQLKEYIEEFQSITKEKPRIKNALQPDCASSKACAEQILDQLSEEHGKLTFGEKVYLVRNIIFHDYKRILGLSSLVSDLEENLINYILDNKLQS